MAASDLAGGGMAASDLAGAGSVRFRCVGVAFRRGRDGYTARMAVPKQKQSHARTTQRRSQHKIETPGYNACPQCHSPRLPHRVCPVCGYYKGREVIVPDRDERIA
jgi:large subunit ribosomal protein L32